MRELILALQRADYLAYSALIEMRDRLKGDLLLSHFDTPEEILDDFGLECDYVMDLISLLDMSDDQIALQVMMYAEKDD